MIFKGISKRFSTKNNIQYSEIGDFWDYFSDIYGMENLLGLGLNWQKDSIEYVIGHFVNQIDYNLEDIQKKYPDAVYKEIILPDIGWKTYSGQTEKLSDLYRKIYRDGAILYEIESFYNDGTCLVKIIR